jgi:hypothetical protein
MAADSQPGQDILNGIKDDISKSSKPPIAKEIQYAAKLYRVFLNNAKEYISSSGLARIGSLIRLSDGMRRVLCYCLGVLKDTVGIDDAKRPVNDLKQAVNDAETALDDLESAVNDLKRAVSKSFPCFAQEECSRSLLDQINQGRDYASAITLLIHIRFESNNSMTIGKRRENGASVVK